ncbi:MAG: MmgE/PrpD family protein [Chloroflexi bacterium]|nr:MmgE/PrpD family protein [Chloroflexota bacterium]
MSELDKFSPGKWPCVLTVRTRDGREFTRFHDQPAKGEPQNPFTPREIEAKFRKVVSPVLKPDKLDRLLDILRRLEDVDDISELASLMAANDSYQTHEMTKSVARSGWWTLHGCGD